MNEKKIVVPGDFLTSEIKKLGSNVYINNNKIYSSVIGILSESPEYISVIALNGAYTPSAGDGLICVVKQEAATGYVLEFNSPTDTYLPKSTLRRNLDVGTVIFARIANISDNDSIELDNINILPVGTIYSTSCVKVPRIIGKNESMLNILKENTQSNIVVGKNGWIWFSSKNPKLLVRALDLVVKNSQKSNLTNSVKEFLEKNKTKW